MATPLDPRRLPRRGVLRLVGAALAAAGLGAGQLRGASGARRQRRIYVFNPEWGAGRTGCPSTRTATHERGGHGCHACTACHRHAKNKRFASLERARKRRAHPHCRCRIEERFVSAREYARMFGEPGSPGARLEYDLRW